MSMSSATLLGFSSSISITPFVTLVISITYRLIAVTTLYSPTPLHWLSLFMTCPSDGRDRDTYTNSSHHCNFVWFALSSRATYSTSFCGAHCKGFLGYLLDLPSPLTSPISNSLWTNFIDIFRWCFPMDCNTPDNIFNSLFTHNLNHLHTVTMNTSSTTSSLLPTLTPSPSSPLVTNTHHVTTSINNYCCNGNSTEDHASQRSCNYAQIHIVATKGASMLL